MSNVSEGAGTSASAVHLADTLARETDAKVLIVDLDFLTMGATRHMKTEKDFNRVHSLIPGSVDEQTEYYKDFGAIYSSPCSVADLFTPMRTPINLSDNLSQDSMDAMFETLDEGFSMCIKHDLSRHYDFIILDIPKNLFDFFPTLINNIADFSIFVLGDNDKELLEYENRFDTSKYSNVYNIINDVTQLAYNSIAYAYPQLISKNIGALPEAEEISIMSQNRHVLPLDVGVADHYQESVEFIVHELMSKVVSRKLLY